jgi:hypothetical protein
VVGIAYGGSWRQSWRRMMDFVRFSGEATIYYTLIALGGFVLLVLTEAVLAVADTEFGLVLEDWVLPIAMPGAMIVAAWLVEAKQGLIENIAPVLTRVFTPLTVLMLVAVLVVLLSHGELSNMDREALILFDLILILVVALVLFTDSSRDGLAKPGWFDWLQLGLVVLALTVDFVSLAAMAGRIGEFGSSPNKLAALGLNLLLAAHLAGTAYLRLRLVLGRGRFAALERWQTSYLPVYGVWAALVALVFPPAFGFA